MDLEIPEGYKLIKVNKESLQKAQKKYYEANREKIRASALQKYKDKYHHDPEFRAKERARNLENARRKKV